MSNEKAKFASKAGLIAATVGSAVGLGNIWRFPAETQANGGAAFLIVYIACVFLLGIPVMIAEFSLGRAGGSDAVGSFKNLGARKGWWGVGALSIISSYAILCFYMVVTGWTFEYLLQSVTGYLYEPVTTLPPEGSNLTGNAWQFTSRMNEFLYEGVNPLINTYAVIIIDLIILIIGVQKGIERLSNVLMPLLFLILVSFCGVVMTLPGASEGIAYFFKPDFSAITPSTCINALGQAFFSLSLGMGVLLTYSSYYKPDVKLAKTAVTVSMLDLLVSVMMGIIIFPSVISFGLNNETLEGTSLVFITLPDVFTHLPLTQFWSALFFLLLFVAAITSTISISEVAVAFFADRFRLSRVKACCIVLLPLFVFSTLCSESVTLFNALDNVATNILLPLVSLGICVYVGWFAPKDMLEKQLTNNGTLHSRVLPAINFIIRWIAPVLIVAVLASYFLK